MLTVAAAALAAMFLSVPHVLALDREGGGWGATAWFFALALRALVAVFGAVLTMLYVPSTAAFAVVARWCAEDVLPTVAHSLPLEGHVLGALTIGGPSLVLAGSVVLVARAVATSARRLNLAVSLHGLPGGPRGSLIVRDDAVFVAAVGLRRPAVVVSTGALLRLDDAELAASIEHERGHIARRHRHVLLAAELLRALARVLPGTAHAMRELRLHLERDADAFAFARQHDPEALMGAVDKARSRVTAEVPPELRRRLEHATSWRSSAPMTSARLRAAMAAMFTVAALSLAVLPASAVAGVHAAERAMPEGVCR